MVLMLFAIISVILGGLLVLCLPGAGKALGLLAGLGLACLLALGLAKGRAVVVRHAGEQAIQADDSHEHHGRHRGHSHPVEPAIAPKTPLLAEAPEAESPAKTAGQASSSTDRPVWVDAPPAMQGDVYCTSVKSGLYATRTECQAALAAALKQAVETYSDKQFGPGAANAISIEPESIKSRVQKAEFTEIVNTSVGPMMQLHARLEFDDSIRTELQESRRQSLVTARLWHVGAFSTLLLAAIGAVFGYLKLDLATAGRHTRRLQLAAAAFIVGAAAAGFAVRYVAPFQ